MVEKKNGWRTLTIILIIILVALFLFITYQNIKTISIGELNIKEVTLKQIHEAMSFSQRYVICDMENSKCVAIDNLTKASG